jgi:hypothetical protein
MNSYLSLSLSGLTVTFSEFLDSKIPRVKAEAARVERSAAGNLLSYGASFEDPHLWVFNASVTLAEAELVEALYWEHCNLRRNFQPFEILVIDTTWRLQERAPRSRATAPSPFDQVAAIGSLHIKYYAQFWAVFSQKPEFTEQGASMAVTVALQEADRKVTP